MSESISIVIADDHEVVRNGIRAYLNNIPEFEVKADCGSGEEAVQLTAQYKPDLVILDLLMEEGQDGVETTRQIKRISPHTNVVILTSFHDDQYIFPALKAGAIAYLLKDMKMDKLVEVLKHAARGEVYLHPTVAMRVLQNFRGDEIVPDRMMSELTQREMDVLKQIAQGLSNSEVAEVLEISEYTVKGHVSNILNKLGLSDRTQAAVYAWRQGIVKRNQEPLG